LAGLFLQVQVFWPGSGNDDIMRLRFSLQIHMDKSDKTVEHRLAIFDYLYIGNEACATSQHHLAFKAEDITQVGWFGEKQPMDF
jgi:hypothetical protein